jgi:hypothetical protein
LPTSTESKATESSSSQPFSFSIPSFPSSTTAAPMSESNGASVEKAEGDIIGSHAWAAQIASSVSWEARDAFFAKLSSSSSSSSSSSTPSLTAPASVAAPLLLFRDGGATKGNERLKAPSHDEWIQLIAPCLRSSLLPFIRQSIEACTLDDDNGASHTLLIPELLNIIVDYLHHSCMVILACSTLMMPGISFTHLVIGVTDNNRWYSIISCAAN